MNPSSLIVVLAVLSLLMATMYAANRAQVLNVREALVGRLWFVLVGLMTVYGMLIGLSAFAVAAEASPVDPASAVIMIAITLCAAGLAVGLIRSHVWRGRASAFLPGFHPDSPVHLTAVILSLGLLIYAIGNLILSGGTAGVAQAIGEQGVDLLSVIVNQGLWIIGALFGVGLFLRRDLRGALLRLGLRVPQLADIGWGITVGVISVVLIYAFAAVWSLLADPATVAAQSAASQQIAASFSTIPSAFILAATVAIGEETFFRGALQPIFGLVITSLYFVVLHVQYALSPATVALFIVALLFGWLRRRYSTTAAVIAHFVYNFIQLYLAILASAVLKAIGT